MDTNTIISICVIGVVLILIGAYLIITRQKDVKEWLKYAVIAAEKELGSGTGQLKLRQVYDWFTGKFKIFSIILPFKVFCAWVETALETMENWLSEYDGINEYVHPEIEEDVEDDE